MQYDFLQLVISSPLIHAQGDLSQAPTGIRTQVPRLRGRWLTNWAIPPPILGMLGQYHTLEIMVWHVKISQASNQNTLHALPSFILYST